MPAPHNPFKAAIAKGELQIGCWLGLADAYVAEISASAKPQCRRSPSTMRGRRASEIRRDDCGQPMPIGSFSGPSSNIEMNRRNSATAL